MGVYLCFGFFGRRLRSWVPLSFVDLVWARLARASWVQSVAHLDYFVSKGVVIWYGMFLVLHFEKEGT